MKNFIATLQHIWKIEDLRKRIFLTLALILIYRIGSFVILPGINADAMASANVGGGGLGEILALFTGGAFSRASVFALGIMPYISASIIMQLLGIAIPSIQKLQKEGESGRQKINQTTRFLTIAITAVQAPSYLGSTVVNVPGAVADPSLFWWVSSITILTAGTLFIMWLGERITEKGIGNGISLIIFSGIVAEIPSALASTFELGRTGAISSVIILTVLALLLGAIYFIVFVERAQRRILIQYPKRQMGNKIYGGESSYLPLKVNTAGVIPAIFASALLLLPITLSNFSTSSNSFMVSITSLLGQGKPLYMIFYASGIVFFSFFYTSIIFNPTETSDNLKKHGGFVPGIRPGEKTSEFIEGLLTKLTVIGSSYLVIICLLPEVLISKYPIPFYLGGTSLLIVVVVAMDTITQVQTRMMSAQYASLIKKTKFSK